MQEVYREVCGEVYGEVYNDLHIGVAESMEELDSPKIAELVIPSTFSEEKSLLARFLLLCSKMSSMKSHFHRLNVLREAANHGPAGYIDRSFSWSSGGLYATLENSQSPKCIDCSSWFAFHLYQRGIEVSMYVEEDRTADASDPRARDLKLIIEDMIEKTKNSHIAIAHIDTMIVGLPFKFMIKNNAFGLRSLVTELLALFTGVTEKKYEERWRYMYHNYNTWCAPLFDDIPIVPTSVSITTQPSSTAPKVRDIALTSECSQETKLRALNLAIGKTIEEMESAFKDQAYFEEIKSGGLVRYIVPGHPDCANLGAWFNEVMDYCERRGDEEYDEFVDRLRSCIELMIEKMLVSCISVVNIRYLVLHHKLSSWINDINYDPELREMLLNLLGLFTGVEERYITLSDYLEIHGH
jgi:hypothetical protein